MSLIKAIIDDDYELSLNMAKEGCFNPTERDPSNGYSLLHHCVEFGEAKLVSLVLKNEEVLACIEKKNYEDETPLAIAVLSGFEDIALILLAAGANPSTLCKEKSMLMLAATVKSERMTEILINRDIDINYSNKGGSALHYAILHDNEPMISSLVSHPEVCVF